jgi:hypothetical protein
MRNMASRSLKHFKLTIILVVILMSNCTKTEEEVPIITKVHGHLMVLGTDEIINDRPYKIQLISSNRSVLKEVYTDENGYYEFEFEGLREEYHSFYLEFDRSDFPDDTYTGGIALKIDTIEQPFLNGRPRPGSYKGDGGFFAGYRSWANVNLEKKAWVELHVENIDPNIGDRISIRYASHRGTGSWEYVFHDGANFKVILPGVGNVENIIEYWVTKNGISIPLQIAKPKLGEMDTTYFKLEY